MRYRSAWWVVLFCAIGAADEPGKLSGSLVVSLTHERALPAGVLQSMEREVEGALAPSGVEIAWQDGLRPEVYERLAVIHLRGDCRADALIPGSIRLFRSGAEALGQTQVVDGKILPIADVQCDAVRKFIDRDLQAAPAASRDELLGRALGRVTAHELYHILLRARSHGRDGLARPAQTSAELLTPHQPKLPDYSGGYVADNTAETGR